ncbi:MAG: hypothetical protein ACOC2W_00865 [bacterium]
MQIYFEEDYENIKLNPNILWENYFSDFDKYIFKPFSYKYSFRYEKIISKAYIFFRRGCKKYNPYYNGGFIPFIKYIFKHIKISLQGFILYEFKKRKRVSQDEIYAGKEGRNNLTNNDLTLVSINNMDLSFENYDFNIEIENILSNIDDNYKKTILLTLEGYNQYEIGEYLNLSQSRISQILRYIKAAPNKKSKRWDPYKKLYKLLKDD